MLGVITVVFALSSPIRLHMPQRQGSFLIFSLMAHVNSTWLAFNICLLNKQMAISITIFSTF